MGRDGPIQRRQVLGKFLRVREEMAYTRILQA